MKIAIEVVVVLAVVLVTLIAYLITRNTRNSRHRRRLAARAALRELSQISVCPDLPPELHVVLDSERAVVVTAPAPPQWMSRVKVSAVVLMVGAVVVAVSTSSTPHEGVSRQQVEALPPGSDGLEPQSVRVTVPDLPPSSIAKAPTTDMQIAQPVILPTMRPEPGQHNSSQPIPSTQPPSSPARPSPPASRSAMPASTQPPPTCVATVQVQAPRLPVGCPPIN